MQRRAQAGGGVATLLALLGMLAGLVGYNYHRNLEAEAQEKRPYRGYAEEDLAKMLAAYEGRKAGQVTRYESRTKSRVQVQGKAYFDDQVREFERVQRANHAKAAARDELAGTQVVVKAIQAEQRKRDAERNKWMLFLRRAFTVKP